MEVTEITQRAKEFDKDRKYKKLIDQALKDLSDFSQMFSFRINPSQIDNLTPQQLYNPGASDRQYFFYWIEHRLRPLGRYGIGGAEVYRQAVSHLQDFKELLKIVVSGDRSLAEKVDADWNRIYGLGGGDRLIVKKIICCFYPETTFPVFKTEHLEIYAQELGIDYRAEARERYGRDYQMLTLGEKWQFLGEKISNMKQTIPIVKDWHNAYFMRFLYETFVPARTQWTVIPGVAKPVDRSSNIGLLWEPKSEMEVVFLFAKFHKELGFPYVLEVKSSFPDMRVLDNEKRERKIECELIASNFRTHGHSSKECDHIVCWVNDLDEDDELNTKVISLKDELESIDLL